jgi:hypothetical protein
MAVRTTTRQSAVGLGLAGLASATSRSRCVAVNVVSRRRWLLVRCFFRLLGFRRSERTVEDLHVRQDRNPLGEEDALVGSRVSTLMLAPATVVGVTVTAPPVMLMPGIVVVIIVVSALVVTFGVIVTVPPVMIVPGIVVVITVVSAFVAILGVIVTMPTVVMVLTTVVLTVPPIMFLTEPPAQAIAIRPEEDLGVRSNESALEWCP